LKLCIAEKPSVAKEIANVLGAKGRRDGYFEGNGYCVTWTFGHLCTLKMPDDYKAEWKKWNLNTLPMIPEKFDIKLIGNRGVGKQFKTIKLLVSSCDEVINCGDAGIEGELIQRWVLRLAKCSKPIKRLWISSLTEEAIRQGFENLKESSQYDFLYAAGESRAIGDWVLGMNATRLYTLKYANGKGVLSVGRVQTPTLALIVKRHKEIENFVSKKYWELKTTYRKIIFSLIDGRFKKNENAIAVLNDIEGKDFTIISFDKKRGREQPPLLFDLTSLQVECNKIFGYTADNTLKTIQKLYERKFVSYPRVDTRYLPDDIFPKVANILQRLNSVDGYGEFISPLLENKIKKSKRVFDDKKVTDHHAIIPTGVVPKGLTSVEENVYHTIIRRFVAVFYPDAIISNTTVEGEVETYKFRARGKEIVEPGWRVLYPKSTRTNFKGDGEPQNIPKFDKGESGSHSPLVVEKQTKPPKEYTEATLLRAMETAGKQIDDEELRLAMKDNGIGRPSTRANIIETLFKRNYVKRIKKNIIPQSTGIELIEIIESELLKSVELTGQWESKLHKIERGEYSSDDFRTEMMEMVGQLVDDVKGASKKIISLPDKKRRGKGVTRSRYGKTKKASGKVISKGKDSNSQVICPKCGKGKIIKGKTAYGCANFRQGCDFRVPFEIAGKKLTEKQSYTLIQKGKSPELSGFLVDGKKRKGQLIINQAYCVKFIPSPVDKGTIKKGGDKQKNDSKLICPICKKGRMIKGRTAYGCSRYKEGCNFIISFDILKSKYGRDILDVETLERVLRDL